MPRKLLPALAAEGHDVESVKSLQLAGIDNGALYEFAASNYDLCFTRDAEFSRRVRSSKPAARLKLGSRTHSANAPRRVRAAISHRVSRDQIGRFIRPATIGHRVTKQA